MGGREGETREGRDVGLSRLAHFDLGDASGIGNGLGACRDTGADEQEDGDGQKVKPCRAHKLTGWSGCGMVNLA